MTDQLTSISHTSSWRLSAMLANLRDSFLQHDAEIAGPLTVSAEVAEAWLTSVCEAAELARAVASTHRLDDRTIEPNSVIVAKWLPGS